jgi:multiple sugar transport system permease protein
VSSFKTAKDVSSTPPSIVPKQWTFQNFIDAFVTNDLAVYMLNSVIVAVSTTVIVLVLALMAGYAFTGRKVRGGTGIMTGLLMLSVFPAVAILTPVYLIERQVGLLNSYPGLIIPYVAFNLPFAIWIMRNYLQGIPSSIEEACELDGAGAIRTVWSVILPMSRPGLFTAGVFTFTAAWSEFLMALTFNSTTGSRTIPVGIALFGTQFSTPYGQIFAASVAATVPIVILVLIFRKSIVSGLTSGAVKG